MNNFKRFIFLFILFNLLINKIKTENFFTDSIGRFGKISEAINISICLGENSEPGKTIKKICKKYFGLNSMDLFSNNFLERKEFLSNILNGMKEFNNNSSNETKYFLDQQIKYILSFSFNTIKDNNPEIVTKICSIVFFICTILPTEYIENINSVDSNIEWKKITSKFKLIFNEIGIENNSFLYSDLEKHILDKLFESDIFMQLKAGHGSILKFLNEKVDDKNELIKNNYKTFINNLIKKNSELNFDKLLDLNTNIFSWINSNNFNNSMKLFTDEDIIFILMIIGRLNSQQNIDKLNLNNNEIKILNKYSILSREILNNIFKICKIKEINWKEFVEINLNKKQIELIVNYLSKYSISNDVLSKI